MPKLSFEAKVNKIAAKFVAEILEAAQGITLEDLVALQKGKKKPGPKPGKKRGRKPGPKPGRKKPGPKPGSKKPGPKPGSKKKAAKK